MTPRQRVLTALERQEPDSVPYELPYGSFTPALMEVFRNETGADDPEEYFAYPVRSVSFGWPSAEERWRTYFAYYDSLPEGSSIGGWGEAQVPGSMFHFTRHVAPLRNAESVRAIEEYPLPDLEAPRFWSHLAEDVAALHARDLASMGELGCTIFETSWAIRGLEECLIDMQCRPELAEALFERVTQVRERQARRYAEAGVDILRLGDDISGQNGMMFSVDLWRRLLKPRLARVIAAAREVNPDIIVFYHSDGNCADVVSELADIGVDVLNPVQPECMDPAAMKREHGHRLAFWGTIGTQTTMPFGSPEDVMEEIRVRMETVGCGGGLLLAPSHILEPDVPWANVLAFFEGIRRYGNYS
jgi:uroporphyrinogen decarboxylase